MTPDDYRQAVRELARGTTMPDGVAATMEAELERAFEAAAPAAGSNQPPLKLRRSAEAFAKTEDPALQRRYGVLAAAAALVATVGATAWYAGREPVTSNNVTGAPSSATSTGSPTVAAIEDRVHPKVDTTDRGNVRLQADGKHPKRLPPVIRPEGFVPVPMAAGLPQFESGVIVRVALPAAALPSYGIDISPASSDRPVEADVLVGQDGVARAIRLVNTSRSQQ